MTDENNLSQLIHTWVNEDIGDGDFTSLSTIKANAQGSARLLIKQSGVLAGIRIAIQVFQKIDDTLQIETHINDGSKVKNGDVALLVRGNIISILSAERLVLNIIQRMSGIATQTRQFVDTLKGTQTKILDTRKTTPGMRLLEKEAVVLGGGVNHRFGLFDQILIKDNHIDFAGSIEKAIQSANNYLAAKNKKLYIVVETRSLADVETVIKTGGVQRIMFDNFSPAQTKKAVELVAGAYPTESSGGITLENIREYALAGTNYISVGALTHQIKSLDMSLKAIKQ